MDIKFPVKIRDIYKIQKKNYIGISLFGVENKEQYQLMWRKNIFKRHVELLLIEGEGDRRHYVLIKDFNTFMYDHALQQIRRLFFRYF